jgi:hypothetical protein
VTSTQGGADDDALTAAGDGAGGDVSAGTLSTDGGAMSAAAGDGTLTASAQTEATAADTLDDTMDDPTDQGDSGYREARVTTAIAAGDTVTVTIRSSFKPKRAVVDPDVQLLMLEREAARREVE